MDNKPRQVVYVGAFRLPDQNAAAQRVLANAKGLRALGLDVVLVEVGDSSGSGGPPEHLPDFEGFSCYRLPIVGNGSISHPYWSIGDLIELIDSLESPVAVIAYNYPAFALARLLRFCRRRQISCVADATEWYGTRHLKSQFSRLAKWGDTTLRMRFIHKRLDGVVVISRYLESYYRKTSHLKVIRLPALVDTDELKWVAGSRPSGEESLRLVWAGSYGADKERLDLAVEAVVGAAEEIDVHLDVIGITASEFRSFYPRRDIPCPEVVTFHGRISHHDVLGYVSSADYSIIVRDSSRVTEAGFPTKFVESITLGTPALVTPHPDLSALISSGENGRPLEVGSLSQGIIAASESHCSPQRDLFDYRKFNAGFSELASLIRRI